MNFSLHLKCTWFIKVIVNWDLFWVGHCVCWGVWGRNGFLHSAFKQIQLAKWVLTHWNLKSNSWAKHKLLLLPWLPGAAIHWELTKSRKQLFSPYNSHNHLDQFRYCFSKRFLKTLNVSVGDERGCSSYVLCSLQKPDSPSVNGSLGLTSRRWVVQSCSIPTSIVLPQLTMTSVSEGECDFLNLRDWSKVLYGARGGFSHN